MLQSLDCNMDRMHTCHILSRAHLTVLAEEQALKPFTCEVDIEPCWYNY